MTRYEDMQADITNGELDEKNQRLAILERRDKTRAAWARLAGIGGTPFELLDAIRDCIGPDGRGVE